MRNRTAILCLTAATCFAATSFASTIGSKYSPNGAKAGHAWSHSTPKDYVLYDNGPDDGVTAYTISGGYFVADSFGLNSDSTLNSATFSNWFMHGDTGSQIDWAITTMPFGGTTIASGTAAITGVFEGTNGLGADVYSETFSLGGVALNGNFQTYYLQLGNEVVTNGDPGYWGESNGTSTACQSGNGLNCVSIPSESFSLSGIGGAPPPEVPEPASLVLLSTGILGAAGVLRRKLKL